jgi:hypothetical protein
MAWLVKIRNGVGVEGHTTVPPPASQVIKTSPFFTEKSGSYFHVNAFNNGALGYTPDEMYTLPPPLAP